MFGVSPIVSLKRVVFPLCEAARGSPSPHSGFVSTPRKRSSTRLEDQIPPLSAPVVAIQASQSLVEVAEAPDRGRSTPGPRAPRGLSERRSRARECDRRDNQPPSPIPANLPAALVHRRATTWARHVRTRLLPPAWAMLATAAQCRRVVLHQTGWGAHSERLLCEPARDSDSQLLHTSIDHLEDRGRSQRLGRARFGRGQDGLVHSSDGFP